MERGRTMSAVTRLSTLLIAGAVVAGLLVAHAPHAAADDPLTVYTVSYPLAYFAERIGGDHVKVTFPAPPDVDPAYWMPDANTIAGYQGADVILLNGAGYADWVEKTALSQFRLVDTAAGFADVLIELDDIVTHSHGPTGEHSHEGTLAFTTWLDFRLAVLQAGAVEEALSKRRPALAKELDANFEELKADLQAIDDAISEITASIEELPLVMSHPVYQYFTRRYGLNAVSVHWEPDVVPDAPQWLEFEELLQSHPAEWMIWEGEPLEASVAKLAAAGVGSTVFDPCGNRPEEGDFLAVMNENVENLRAAYED
jgi:zinc transport system substrate-binding protein